MGEKEAVKPFKYLRYANTTGADQEVQVDVEYEHKDQIHTEPAYDPPQPAHPVADGQNTVTTPPDLEIPYESTVKKLTVKWGPVGMLDTSLAFTLDAAPDDIYAVIALQGPEAQDAAAFDAGGNILGGKAKVGGLS